MTNSIIWIDQGSQRSLVRQKINTTASLVYHLLQKMKEFSQEITLKCSSLMDMILLHPLKTEAPVKVNVIKSKTKAVSIEDLHLPLQTTKIHQNLAITVHQIKILEIIPHKTNNNLIEVATRTTNELATNELHNNHFIFSSITTK